MLSSFAVGARFTGSAVNNSVGATSQLSLFVSGVAALAVMPVLAPLLYYLPKPTLSIVVVFAVAGVVDLRAWYAKPPTLSACRRCLVPRMKTYLN